MELVDLYAQEMPRLQALESLTLATAMAMGTGNMKQHQLDSVRRMWQHQARGGPEKRKAKAMPKGEMVGLLAGMGVGYKEA